MREVEKVTAKKLVKGFWAVISKFNKYWASADLLCEMGSTKEICRFD